MSHVNVQSFKVLTTLAAQRFVAMVSSTADTVQYPESGQNFPVGISIDSVVDTTSALPCAGVGSIAKVYFNDTLAAGQPCKSDTSGRAVAFTLSNTTTSLTLTSCYAGILVGATVAATGTIADVFFCPGFARTSA